MPFPQLLPLTASSTSEVTCLDIFLRDPTAFNEEVCESSLSHLARAATSRPNLRYYDAANKTYKRLGFTAAVNTLNQEMTTSRKPLDSLSRPKTYIQPDCAELRQT